MYELRVGTQSMDDIINGSLGDQITYTQDGSDPVTFAAWVEFGSAGITTQGSRSSGEQIVIEAPFDKVSEPTRGDRVDIPLRPENRYAPSAWEPSPTGEAWRITLKKAE